MKVFVPLVLAAVLLLAGCGERTAPEGSAAPSSGSPPMSVQSASPLQPRTAAVPRYPAEPPFGPEGFGQVVLGLAADRLLALPGVEIVGENDQCRFFEAPGVSGGIQAGLGVAYLGIRGDLETPERIHEGSTYDEVAAAYPRNEGDEDIVAAAPPGYDDRYYRIEIWRGQVAAIALMHRDQHCAS
ncbi:hypothetical protein [Nocardioides sp. SR21]|uniref:hypothetical protein n=1 Tax=Nocardioides sp. SR21 TaxID=2919501 RepID=UPI001FAB030D|nr:hypothetical protein [Nocardioides sp. SR21]